MYVVYGEGIHIHVHLRLEGNAACPLSLLSYNCEAGPSTEPGPKLMVSKTLQIFLPPAHTHTHTGLQVCVTLYVAVGNPNQALKLTVSVLTHWVLAPGCRVFHLFAAESKSPEECWDYGHIYPTMPGLHHTMNICITNYA